MQQGHCQIIQDVVSRLAEAMRILRLGNGVLSSVLSPQLFAHPGAPAVGCLFWAATT